MTVTYNFCTYCKENTHTHVYETAIFTHSIGDNDAKAVEQIGHFPGSSDLDPVHHRHAETFSIDPSFVSMFANFAPRQQYDLLLHIYCSSS